MFTQWSGGVLFPSLDMLIETAGNISNKMLDQTAFKLPFEISCLEKAQMIAMFE